MSRFDIRKIIRNSRGFLVFVLLMCCFRTVCADWSFVPSESMEPTIYPGDFLWIDKMSYGPTVPLLNKRVALWGSPDRGDIITFIPPHTDQLYVKRVIGLPGDNLHIEGENIYINGDLVVRQLTDSTDAGILGQEFIDDAEYRFKLSKDRSVPYFEKSFAVPEGKYFVMGDHRNNSLDSRYWGMVDESRVMGKVTSVALSFSAERGLFERVALPIE
ncbi:signal peptidase I [Microbulbifer sp. ZKSA006]|uniref:signal peptidase I n=1 Tax=Microbulbifer sp. ZKSA006 TaxID=3243390 RepID=UPI004039F3B3